MRQSQRVHVSVNENAAGRVLIYRTGGVRLTGLPPCDRRSPLAFLLSSTHLTTRRRHFHHVAERLAISFRTPTCSRPGPIPLLFAATSQHPQIGPVRRTPQRVCPHTRVLRGWLIRTLATHRAAK